MPEKEIRVAVLDLNNGFPNQGMGNIRAILKDYKEHCSGVFEIEEFDVRAKNQLPDISFDIYISSGGPGSPFDGVDAEWEERYFALLDQLRTYNENAANAAKKYFFFICHSFQMACRYFNVGDVTRRVSTSFGVFPMHLTEAGKEEAVFKGLQDPFYAVDSRDWQVINADVDNLKQKNIQILAIEKERLHVPYERAIMAIRFTDEMIGTQFHPEADGNGMRKLLLTEERKAQIIPVHGLEKYEDMLQQLNDPDKIMFTHHIILPTFLDFATGCKVLFDKGQ